MAAMSSDLWTDAVFAGLDGLQSGGVGDDAQAVYTAQQLHLLQTPMPMRSAQEMGNGSESDDDSEDDHEDGRSMQHDDSSVGATQTSLSTPMQGPSTLARQQVTLGPDGAAELSTATGQVPPQTVRMALMTPMPDLGQRMYNQVQMQQLQQQQQAASVPQAPAVPPAAGSTFSQLQMQMQMQLMMLQQQKQLQQIQQQQQQQQAQQAQAGASGTVSAAASSVDPLSAPTTPCPSDGGSAPSAGGPTPAEMSTLLQQVSAQSGLIPTPGLAALLQLKQPLLRKWPFLRPKSEEELKAKKDKRRMHNRISAKLARERKKKFVACLEEQLLQLQQSVFQLDTMRTMLQQENQRLKEEVQVMRNDAM